MQKRIPETKIKNVPLIFLLLALKVLLLIRLIPILKSPLSNYGYDYGFYLYAASHASGLHLNNFLTALWGGYNNPLFYLACILRIPAGLIITFLQSYLAGRHTDFIKTKILKPEFLLYC